MGSGGVAVDVIGKSSYRRNSRLLFVLHKDNSFIISHNRPCTVPYPNPWSHPLPTFTYFRDTRVISVKFHIDPIPSATWPRPDSEWKDKAYVIAARCRKGMKIPRFQEIKRWAPDDHHKFSDRWTSKAGHYNEPGTPNNLGIEERAIVGEEVEERIQWVLESV